MKTALKIRIIHNRSKIKQTKNKWEKKTGLKAHSNKEAYKKQQQQQQKTNKQTNKRKKQKNKLNKITQLLTAAPELVTLDCSFTHVLQAPNTQPYHS